MSIMYHSETYYWPYDEGEPIQRYEFVLCLGQALTLPDGNSFLFGAMERFFDVDNNSVCMIFYICSTTSHTHTDRPSCSRLVMTFHLANGLFY